MFPAQDLDELQSLIDEQRRIESLVAAERAWWQEVREYGKPRFGEMSHRLTELRKAMAAHFAHEERAGQAAAQSGRCTATPDFMAAIAREHNDLLRRLDAMIERAKAEVDSYSSWGEVGIEFSELIHAIDEHEREELRLLSDILSRLTSPPPATSAV